MKQSFSFGDMNIMVRAKHLTPKINQALLSGRYENAERNAILTHVNAQDRVLDLGGGIGCTGIAAGKIVGGHNLMIVEANGDLLSDISDNLAYNGVIGAQLVQGAVVAAATTKHIKFYKSKGFWAGSLSSNNAPFSRAIKVLAVPLPQIIQAFRPSVIICDTEGVETEIFKDGLPEFVRLIILELHPKLYEQSEIKCLFDNLSDMGFSYLPFGSNGPVICMGK